MKQEVVVNELVSNSMVATELKKNETAASTDLMKFDVVAIEMEKMG